MGGVEDVERLNQIEESPTSESSSYRPKGTGIGLKFATFVDLLSYVVIMYPGGEYQEGGDKRASVRRERKYEEAWPESQALD